MDKLMDYRWPLLQSRAGEPEPGVFGFLEPEPLEKKQDPEHRRSRLEKKSGAGAA